MPFDTRDWLCCPELKVLPADVRGLWIDMLCYMWESPVRGVMVKPNGLLYTQAEIVRMLGTDAQGSSAWLQRLIDAGVCGVREDGAIISRRMVREEDLRQKRAVAGRKGGEATQCRTEPRKAPKEAETSQEEPFETELFPGVQTVKPQKPKKAKKEEEPKIEYAEFVHLTQTEYDKLVADYGEEQVAWMIKKLDNTKGANGNKYKSDYRAILNWVVKAYNQEFENGKDKHRNSGSGAETSGGFATGTTL